MDLKKFLTLYIFGNIIIFNHFHIMKDTPLESTKIASKPDILFKGRRPLCVSIFQKEKKILF